MIASLRTLLLAALCAAICTTAASPRDLQLGTPIKLSVPAEVTEVDPRAPSDPERVAVSKGQQENLALGVPRGALASSGNSDVRKSMDDRVSTTALNSIGREGWQVLGALAAVVGLLFVLRAAVMRVAPSLRGGGRPSGVLEILARYPITRGQYLVLIKLARRILLVHQSGSAMTTLSEVSDSDEVAALLGRIEAGAASPRDAARFRSLLNQFSRQHDPKNMTESYSGVPDAWDGGEVVDLTKRQAGFAKLFSRSEREATR